VATDYPDWGALAALQTFITNLNLASQDLQASATAIADAIAAAGVPPYIPSLQSASLDGESYGTPALLSDLESDIRLWGVWVSAVARAQSAYSTATTGLTAQVFADSTLSEVTTTLAEVQLLVYEAGDLDRGDVFLPLGGVELLASGTQPATVTLSVNGGTSVTAVAMRAAAGVLYTRP